PALFRDDGGRVHRAGARRHGDPRAPYLPDHVHRPRQESILNRKFLIHRTPEVARLERRLFLKRGLSLGALAMLSGCNLTDQESVQRVLWAMSRWNDRAQDWLFDPKRLAPEFPESAITKPFPFNAFYGEDEVVEVDGGRFKLEVGGLVQDKKSWTLPRLY